MTINEQNFIYANESSEKYGVILCTFDTATTDTNDEETNIITSTTPYKDTWDFHILEKAEPLQFSLTIAKKNGTYFDAYELRAIKKWLCKGNRNWLQIDQQDISNAYYNCILTNPRPVDVGMRNAGLQFNVTCDAPYAWSELKDKSYSCATTKQILINIDADFDNYVVYPILTIKPSANGNISIKNISINKEIVLNNCLSTETIYFDCRNYKIKSSNGRVILDNWNKNNLGFRDGNNSLTLTGAFVLQIQYRTPIRIGG